VASATRRGKRRRVSLMPPGVEVRQDVEMTDGACLGKCAGLTHGNVTWWILHIRPRVGRLAEALLLPR
jgi:hypothetical protein